MMPRGRPTEHERSDEHPAHRKVALLAAVLLILTTLVGVTGVVSLRAMQHDLEGLAQRDGRILTELNTVQQLAFRSQLALEEAATAVPADQPAAVAEAQAYVTETFAQFEQTSTDPDAPQLTTTAATFGAWIDEMFAIRRQVADGTAIDLTRVRNQFAVLTESLDADVGPLNERVMQRAEHALDRADLENTVMAVVVLLGLIVGLLVSRTTYRAARAQHIAITRGDSRRAIDAARGRVEAQVSQSLEFARSDTDALRAAELALRQLHPDRPTELLLADSSRAHFAVGLRSSSEAGAPGCSVPTPNACPAVARGQTLVFPDGGHFDSCPFLRDRPTGPRSAICIPVSISGTAEGVLHSTGPDKTTIDSEVRHHLEYIAARTGDRIGVLRAFSRSEAQAATDPLTGLANRRSFEDRVGGMLRDGTDVTIAFGDIDHFKALNDAHGHDVGDRALRTFARTFRDAVRPGDLIARWGGEEFVAAFPSTSSAAVVGILERLQEHLVVLVASGVVPPFTVSFGVADQYDGDDLESLVMAADGALLGAKRAGRDRILLASEQGAGAVRSLLEPSDPRLGQVSQPS